MATHYLILPKKLKNIRHTVCAEIGVARGRLVESLLSNLPGIKTYYCIDPWQDNKIYNQCMHKLAPWGNKTKILRFPSHIAVRHIEDQSLDFCYIDGNHTYDYVSHDITGWWPKVKNGGILAGHDYGMLGVKTAVDEAFTAPVLLPHTIWWVKK